MLKNLAEEVLKAQSDVAISIVVVLLEDIRHALQGDAALDEEVEAHDTLLTLVVRAEQQLDELGAEAVAEGDQSVAELGEGDVAAPVDVEAVEEGAPGGEEGPETAELVETDAAVAVGIEHADHHADRLRVEGGPVSVHERS